MNPADPDNEHFIRQWFLNVELNQAVDTLNVVAGVIEARLALQPKRKTRADKGTTKQGRIELREPGQK